MSTTLTQTQVSSLYVAIFNRASEGEGNQFWQSINLSMEDTATEMLKAPDAISYFGSSLDSNQAFIEHIYKNTLNKTVTDDSAGISFWVGLLDSGAKTRGEVVKGLIEAVVNGDFTGDAKALEAQAQFNNRVEVSNHMAETVHDTPENYAQVTSFNGDLVVTSDSATVTAANAMIDDMVHVAGDTIVVTSGLVDGTDNDDTFLASRGDIDGAVIQAKAGEDTLKANISQSDDDNSALTSYDLENVMLRNTSGDTNIDLLDANGLKEVWNDRSSDGTSLELSGVSTDVTVGIKNTSTATTVNYEGVNGSSDTVNVKLDGAKEGASFVASGVENLNLDVKSDSYLDISANAGLESVVITSSSDMTIKSKGSNISITGGEGEDTLILSGALGANLELSNIEKLAVDGTTSLDLDNVNIEEVVSLNGTLTASNVEDEKILITSDDDATNSSTAGLTATLKSATGTDDAISVEILNKDTATDKNIKASLNLADTEVLNIETNAESGANEKVTIDLTTSTTGTANQTLNISGNAVAEFVTTAVASKTIDASTNTAGVELTLGAEDQTITGTAQSDIFDFGVNATADDTVDGGAGDDMVMFEVNGADGVSAVTSNVETASVKFTSANSFDSANLAGVSLVKVNGAEGTLSNILSNTDVEVDGDVATSVAFELKNATGTSDALNIKLDDASDQSITALTANGVETINFSVLNDDADSTTISTLSADDVKAITISSQEESFEISTFATPDLTSIDATGFGGNLTLGELANTSSATITLGNQKVNTVDVSLTLESAKSISDTISFGDSLIGDVVITNFKEGVSIASDTLDFSAYGVHSVSDLDISTVGGNTIIDIASDANFGQIELIGVVHTDLVDANFDFA